MALSAGALALSCPTYAFASQEGGIQAILPEMSEFIPMLVAFIILWIVLAKFGWPVFDKMLEKRANSIRDDLKNAEEARQESERVLAEYQQQLAEAKVQASKIVADAKKAGEDVKADITAKAQAEAAGMIEKAHAAIEAEKKAAIADLQGSVADLSINVAAKLIGNDLTDDEHRKMIERYVAEAGSFNAK
ncbi:MAG: F0F1 ATP synthase subunit B [Slackia sp.]|nr:F0F1 ATP synthase subunit B [Slackia sp.]